MDSFGLVERISRYLKQNGYRYVIVLDQKARAWSLKRCKSQYSGMPVCFQAFAGAPGQGWSVRAPRSVEYDSGTRSPLHWFCFILSQNWFTAMFLGDPEPLWCSFTRPNIWLCSFPRDEIQMELKERRHDFGNHNTQPLFSLKFWYSSDKAKRG